jgi:myosin heavy subunit
MSQLASEGAGIKHHQEKTNFARKEKEPDEVKKVLNEKEQEVKTLTEERDELFQINIVLEAQNRELVEKIQDLESKSVIAKASLPMISMADYKKEIENKNELITSLTEVINGMVLEQNYKASFKEKEEELKSSGEINTLLQCAVEKKERELKQLRAASKNLHEEGEIRALKLKITEIEEQHAIDVNEVASAYQKNQENIMSQLLVKLDQVKFSSDETARNFQIKELKFQEVEAQLRREISDLRMKEIRKRDPRVLSVQEENFNDASVRSENGQLYVEETEKRNSPMADRNNREIGGRGRHNERNYPECEKSDNHNSGNFNNNDYFNENNNDDNYRTNESEYKKRKFS